MIWVQSTWSCQCPAITVWNGTYCIANPCVGGKIWDNFRRQCLCLGGRVFINNVCIPPEIACKDRNQEWSHDLYKCVCKDGFFDNGYRCIEIPKCPDGRYKDPLNGRCYDICPLGLVWIPEKDSCLDPSCPENQRWDGYGCTNIKCPPNSYFNGT